MTVSAHRNSDFIYDKYRFGKFGEKIFLEDYKNLDIIDVSEDSTYQNVDVDFIVPYKDRHIKVDVKVDTMAHKTGNLVFEVISHSHAGWGVITEADYIYVVSATESLIPIKSYVVDVPLWKQFCANWSTKKRVNVIQSEDIHSILCDIDDMKAYGAIIKEKSYE